MMQSLLSLLFTRPLNENPRTPARCTPTRSLPFPSKVAGTVRDTRDPPTGLSPIGEGEQLPSVPQHRREDFVPCRAKE